LIVNLIRLNSFLYAVATHVLKNYGSGLEKMAFIFPNRRAVQVFKNCLVKLAEKPVWTPRMVSVDDWLAEISSFTEAGKITQLLALFEVVQNTTGQKDSIDQFIRWGEMLLRDFDEIDKYLVEPEKIFQTLGDLKEIETQFPSLDPEQLEQIYKFWDGFHPTPTSFQEKWLKLWKALDRVYEDFHEGLKQKGQASSGYIYRDSYNEILKNPEFSLPLDKYVFIGFNALTEVEERIFDICKDSGKALFYWDIPANLLEPYQESGIFIRQNIRKFPPPESFSNSLLGLQDRFEKPFPPHFKQIDIYACESASGQVNILRKVLNDEQEDKTSLEEGQTAVILADEGLLEPVLSAISNPDTEINISMGYPAEQSRLVDFILRVFKLNTLLPAGKAEKAFLPAGELLQLFQHPMMPFFLADDLTEGLAVLEKWPASMIPLDMLMDKTENVRNLFCFQDSNCLINSLLDILNHFGESIENHAPLETESYRLVREWFEAIKGELGSRKVKINLESFHWLFQEFIKKQRLSFEGSLSAEIQLTGILETRLMDYDELLILSCNEGIWPADSSPPSLIPYNLRKACNLPTREFRDSFYGYYFYRLLQRARKVSLMYVSSPDPGKMSQGDPSRFIQQLRYDSDQLCQEFLSASSLNPGVPPARVIIKTGVVLEALNAYLDKSNAYPLSPSALNSYLDCSFRFALQYLLKIREGEDLVEASEPRMFGKLIHKTMELLYLRFIDSGQRVEKELLDGILKDEQALTGYVKQAFLAEYFELGPESAWPGLFGKDLLVYEVLLKQLRSVLMIDRDYAPFKIIGLESKVKHEVEFEAGGKTLKVKLGGYIDRLDEKDGHVRILDYKSGSPDMGFKEFNDLMLSPNKKRPKEILQALIYSYIYHNIQEKKSPIQPVIYPTGKMRKSPFDPGLSCNSEQILDIRNYLDDIQELLQNILSGIFDPEIDFIQTDKEETCKYCSFKDYCQR